VSSRRVDTIRLRRDLRRGTRNGLTLTRWTVESRGLHAATARDDAALADVLALLEVYEIAEDVAGALAFALSRSEQLEGLLTTWGVPYNELADALRAERTRTAGNATSPEEGEDS
jgi:hypothetical protein